MKYFEEPKIEMIQFAVENILSESSEELPPLGGMLDPLACIS